MPTPYYRYDALDACGRASRCREYDQIKYKNSSSQKEQQPKQRAVLQIAAEVAEEVA